MRKLSVISDQWDVVVVPFPFSEQVGAKRRPAVALSTKTFNRGGHTVLAMITSAAHQAWVGDTPVTDLASAGLRAQCIVRLKLFTLDNRVLLRRSGRLSVVDREQLLENLRAYCW
jgi:mRNA interferase MazF